MADILMCVPEELEGAAEDTSRQLDTQELQHSRGKRSLFRLLCSTHTRSFCHLWMISEHSLL